MKRFLVLLSLALCRYVFAQDEVADATAKFLAGLPLDGTPLESYSRDPAWRRHASEFDRAWTQLEADQLSKIKVWAPQFLGESYTDDAPMFYMFSGPDFLYANAFFPNASTYILCGAEPVGVIPEIDKIPREALDPALTNLRKSLETALSFSFFITKKMKTDLTQAQLHGTLPILEVFLARANYTIESVELVALDRYGNFVEVGKGTTPGVKFVFFGPNMQHQTLYYFMSNLSDEGIRSNPGFMKFCEQQPAGLSLIKAASYLMQETWFGKVRDFLLAHSKIIVQDDSGIPLRFFDYEMWNLRCCGRYVGPIAIFKKYPQPDLAKLFATTAPTPLDFGFGYQWRPRRSSVLIATPK